MILLTKPILIQKFLDRWTPRTTILAIFLILIGVWFALISSPPDYLQGETVRIMYIHVPCSWGALITYFAMAFLSLYAFITQIPMIHLLTKAMAPIGTLLCFLSLITGAIWGKPTWGTWWVWDARLTSMFILMILYVGYLITVYHMKPEHKALKTAAIIALIGSVNLPIIKWSVNWWTTLHQPASIMRIAKPAIAPEILLPLGLMTLAMISFCLTLFFLNLRLLLSQRLLKALILRGPQHPSLEHSHATD